MENARKAAVVLALAAAAVALLAPWRYLSIEGLCIFEPCEPPSYETVMGYHWPGRWPAAFALAGSAALLLPAPRISLGLAALAWLAAAGIALLDTLTGPMVIFGDDLGPGWGGPATTLLMLGAVAVLLLSARRAAYGAGEPAAPGEPGS